MKVSTLFYSIIITSLTLISCGISKESSSSMNQTQSQSNGVNTQNAVKSSTQNSVNSSTPSNSKTNTGTPKSSQEKAVQ